MNLIGFERAVERASDPLKYVIVIERAVGGGFSAWAPDFAGCAALGDTIEECERQMREAIASHLHGLCEDDEPAPQPSSITVAVVELDTGCPPGGRASSG